MHVREGDMVNARSTRRKLRTGEREKGGERTDLSGINDLPIDKQPQAIPLPVVLDPPSPELFERTRDASGVTRVDVYGAVVGCEARRGVGRFEGRRRERGFDLGHLVETVHACAAVVRLEWFGELGEVRCGGEETPLGLLQGRQR